MLTFSEMPDILTLVINDEDLVGCSYQNAFNCPIARKISRTVGNHGGVTRKRTIINGAEYLPAADTVDFINEYDSARPQEARDLLKLPRTVTFNRKKYAYNISLVPSTARVT